MIDISNLSANYPQALLNYERALKETTEEMLEKNPSHKIQCEAGIARTSIRCGDSRKGVTIASEKDKSRLLKKECAEILENMKVIQILAFLLLERGDKYGFFIVLKFIQTAIQRSCSVIRKGRVL